MPKPVIAIVGRPNVGKSTLFNYIAGKRISIVEDTPGVTRDRIYAESDWRGKTFSMIDTGGIEPFAEDEIMVKMRMQANIAIESADVILFMVDLKAGLTASDEEVAVMLRRAGAPVIVVVNKADKTGKMPDEAYEFFNLGFEDVIAISSVNAFGIGDLLDVVYDKLNFEEDDEYDDDMIKVAVVGKPNAGKSSLINQICGEERVIVSDVPGTTRDAIDTIVQREQDTFVLIDTAGLRRKSKISENIEKYSTFRSWNAVERADVCIIMIDAVEGISEQDTKIAGYAHEEGKACIIAVNKWDIYEKETGTLEQYEKQLKGKLKFMDYAPVIFISAKTGQRVENLFKIIKYVNEQSALRLSTGMLNDALNEAIAMVQPPSDRGKRLKIYYTTQVSVKPPKFVLFVNRAELMHFSYQRYIQNHFRKSFGFVGTPIQFILNEKKEKEGAAR